MALPWPQQVPVAEDIQSLLVAARARSPVAGTRPLHYQGVLVPGHCLELQRVVLGWGERWRGLIRGCSRSPLQRHHGGGPGGGRGDGSQPQAPPAGQPEAQEIAGPRMAPDTPPSPVRRGGPRSRPCPEGMIRGDGLERWVCAPRRSSALSIPCAFQEDSSWRPPNPGGRGGSAWSRPLHFHAASCFFKLLLIYCRRGWAFVSRPCLEGGVSAQPARLGTPSKPWRGLSTGAWGLEGTGQRAAGNVPGPPGTEAALAGGYPETEGGKWGVSRAAAPAAGRGFSSPCTPRLTAPSAPQPPGPIQPRCPPLFSCSGGTQGQTGCPARAGPRTQCFPVQQLPHWEHTRGRRDGSGCGQGPNPATNTSLDPEPLTCHPLPQFPHLQSGGRQDSPAQRRCPELYDGDRAPCSPRWQGTPGWGESTS